jgi:hypothetical protein
MAQGVPQFRTIRYISLRGDERGRLTEQSVRPIDFRDLEGREVVLALLRCSTYQGRVPEYVARLLTDAGAAVVTVQGAGAVADRFAADAERAAVLFSREASQ